MSDIGKLNQKQDTLSTPPLVPKKKVLIIEDESDIASIYQQILEEAGYDAVIAVEGKNGLQKIFEISPDIIILDLRMPVMDGKTMLSKLKNDPAYLRYKNIPVVILTNSESYESVRDTKTLGGANEYIIKANIAPNEIIDIVKRNLG
jgi:CheY-like chemotaxis protein